MELDPLLIARWQFGITTVYHFWMVPLTLGLGPLVVFMQWRWLRTGQERYLRMTKFWGKIFVINFIVGVATGLVQEFQFGLAWSEYSRFVGDVFGAPLAMEGLLAFFFESIYLGMWIFGWKRLHPKLHFAALTQAVLASIVSAYFIIVANSWMQHPVGVELIDGRPVLNDIVAVLTNNTAIAQFTHAIFGALAVGGATLVGISWYHLWRRRRDGIDTVGADGRVVVGEAREIASRDRIDHGVWLRSLRIGAIVGVFAFGGVAVSGDFLAKLMYEQQPLKMASAEGACHTGTEFSVLTVGALNSQNCDEIVPVLEIPGVLSFLAVGDFETPVPGINDLEPVYEAMYGTHLPDDPIYGDLAGTEISYLPQIEVTYWGFRLMIGFGTIACGVSMIAFWLARKGTVPAPRWLMRLAVASIAAPFLANSAGWVFTEMGRQPFVVVPNPELGDGVFMFTAAAVSPGVTAGELLFSVISFTVIYGVMLLAELFLMTRYVRAGVAGAMPELRTGDGADAHGGDPRIRGDDAGRDDARDDDDQDDDELPPSRRPHTKPADDDVLAFAF